METEKPRCNKCGTELEVVGFYEEMGLPIHGCPRCADKTGETFRAKSNLERLAYRLLHLLRKIL